MLLLGETFSDGVPKGYLSSRLPRRSQKQHAFPQASQNVQVFRKMVGPNFLRVTCNLIQREEGAGGAEGQGMPSSESDQMGIRNWGLCLLILWWSQQQRGSVISVLLVPVIAWVAQKMPHWGRTLVFGPFYDQFCHESLPVAYALMKFKCLIHAHTVSIYIIFNLKKREKRGKENPCQLGQQPHGFNGQWGLWDTPGVTLDKVLQLLPLPLTSLQRVWGDKRWKTGELRGSSLSNALHSIL